MLPVRIGGFPGSSAFSQVGKDDFERCDDFVIALKAAVHRKTELVGGAQRGSMCRQAVKDCHISCIDPPAYPIASLGCFRPDVSVGALKPQKVRHFLDLE